MKFRDVKKYIGLPYDEKNFDCADLVILIQKEVFGREIEMPSRRPRGKIGLAKMGALSKGYGARTDTPQDGDLVTMIEFPHDRVTHVGVYLFLHYEPYVIHSYGKTQGCVVTRVRDLTSVGLQLEGYYAWN